MTPNLRRLCRSTAVAMAAALAAFVFPQAAVAFQYEAMTDVEMTCLADFVAVGTLSEAPPEAARPQGLAAAEPPPPVTRSFAVEQVLKGKAHAAGEAVSLTQLKDEWAGTPYPPGKSRLLIWFGVDEKKVLTPINLSNAAKPPDAATIKSVEIALKVLAHPKDHLATNDPTELEALFWWLGREWCFRPQPDHPQNLARAPGQVQPAKFEGPVQGVTRQDVVDLLGRLALDNTEALKVQRCGCSRR